MAVVIYVSLSTGVDVVFWENELVVRDRDVKPRVYRYR